MKTTNWQTKALTLFIAVVALCLATACTTYYPIEYPSEGLRITSSEHWETCENEKPLKPSREFVELANQQDPIQTGYPTNDHLRTLPGYDEAVDAWGERVAPEIERIEEVLETYKDRLERYPYYRGSFLDLRFFWDGTLTDRFVVEVHLDHAVDPRTVPPEDRIPGCIAGVPVIIVVGEEYATLES